MSAKSHQQQQPIEIDKADVLKLLQSTLISSKGGVPLDKINREYRNLVGDNIPYRNFGYRDLQEFLNDAKNICKVNYGPDGTAVVRGISSEETAHIQDLVRKQRQTKKPKPQRRPLNGQQHWQPPTITEYSTNHGSSGFRHGFRPPTQHQNGFRQPMINNRYPDQRNLSRVRFMNVGGQGSRLPGGGGNYPNNLQQVNHRLRAPQNGPHMGMGPPPRYSQPQQNTRPMSHRLGPPNGHGPPNASKSNTNYVKMLEDYFAQMGLGIPEFKTSKMEKKQSNVGGGKSSKKGTTITKYYSTVRVSKESFQTYPTEYNSEKEAEEAAAKLACDKLNIGNQFAHPPSVQSQGKTSKDISSDILIERIVELVGKRTNGVWSTSIEKEYSEKYGQALPEHWTERIETYQTRTTVKKRIHIERPIQDRCIIMPFVDQSSNSDAMSPKLPVSPGVAQTTLVAKSVSPNHHSVTPNVMQRPRGPAPGPVAGVLSQTKLPELILPEENAMWDVYVTHIFSTVEVCVRLLGEEYSTKFEDLITEMELHYYDVDKIPHVTKPVIGRIYAAVVEGEWHRVEVISLKGIDVTCYFIDHGGEHDVLNINLLREIEPKFLTLAPQAKRVRLAGLEEYALSPTAHAELTTAALARSLVGQVHSRLSDQDISLILFDTSSTEEDININQMLLEKLKLMPEANVLSNVKNGASLSSMLPTSTEVATVTPLSDSSLASQELDLMSMDLASLKPLIHVVIPEEGQYFDVNVTLAASPSNFTVQPYQESSELERLMSSMKHFYSNSAKHYPLKLEDLSKDLYFAALHSDEQWYRVKINSQLDSCTLAVKIVDFGDYSMVPLENIQPLWPQFRNLPIQAINATLSGIVAIEGDWTVDDTVWFARRVVNNAFVSIIKDVSYDELEDSYKIGISLIDTTNPAADIYIEKELVDSERAVFLCI